jgi:hypothetical protein
MVLAVIGSRRPSRDVGPVGAVFAMILVGQLAVVLLVDPPESAQLRGHVLVGVLLLVAVLVTVAAAVVSFVSYLAWHSGRPVKQAPSVHLGAGVAAGIAAVLVIAIGLGILLSAPASGRGSAGGLLSLVMLLGGLSMGVVAVDVIRNR